MKRITRTTAVLASVSAFAIAAPAFAQVADAAAGQTAPTPAATQGTPDEPAMNDIIVTAQRRAERVTDVPISITVASQAQLERQQVNTVNDLARISPSLEVQQAPGQNTGGGGAIRGIGTQTFSPGAVASVGIVVDQVSQGNANISDLFDVARVEVLKGPQGTLFGLTTSAGVINITTNAPDFTGFSARVRTELSAAGTAGSKYGNQIVQGLVNLPLASNAAIRISGVTNLRQGVDRNAVTGDYNDTDRWGLRGRFLWEPTDSFTINLIGDYSKARSDNGGDFFTFVKAGGPGPFLGDPRNPATPVDALGINARLASCGVTAEEGNRDYCSNRTFHEHFENYGGSLQLDYKADPFTLTSITAYRKSNEVGFGAASDVFRAAPLELQVANGAVNRRFSQFTQEFRVSSPAKQFFEYTAGVFYSYGKQLRDPEATAVTLSPFPGLTVPIVNTSTAAYDIRDESAAVFGQGTFNITPQFRLIAGGRYTEDTLTLDAARNGTAAATHTSLDVQKVSYRFGGQYNLDARTMAYATYSRGFKGGQIATPSAPATPYVVLPEIPTAYEVGLKSTLFGSWVADVSLFYTKIQNFQSQQCTVDANAIISCNQTNVDGVKSRGAEINFFGNVSPNLSLNTGFIWAKATYPKGFLGTDGTNIGGTQLAYAPEYKFTLSGEYTHQVGNSFKGFLAADTVWKSRVRYEANARPDTTFRPHWMVGGRIGLRTEDDRYQIAIFGRNLFDVHEPQLMQSDFPYNGADNVGAIYGAQSFRQVGLSLDAKF